MIEKKMTLASAFRYRGKMDSLIKSITTAALREPIAVKEDEVERRKAVFVRGDLDGDVQLAIQLFSAKEVLNNSIAQANEGATALINRIHSLKALHAFLVSVKGRVVETSLVKTSYRGDEPPAQLVPLFSSVWTDEIKDVRRNINAAEDELSVYNASTIVRFSIPEDIDKLVMEA